MSEIKISNQKNAEEQSIVVDMMVEAMDHLRHCQQLRATYLNLYFIIYAVAISAFSVIVVDLSGGADLELPGWSIGILIWFAGILTIMRTERWTGHILHNLFIARRFNKLLYENNSLLQDFECSDRKMYATNEFRRWPWGKGKSMDTFLAIICTATGAVPFILYPIHNNPTLNTILILCFCLTPFLVWWSEVKALEKSHKACCLRK